MTSPSSTTQPDTPDAALDELTSLTLPPGELQALLPPLSVPPTLAEDELLEQLIEASELQQAGEMGAAIALYQMLAATDPDGHYGATARKALENIEVEESASPGATASGGADEQDASTPPKALTSLASLDEQIQIQPQPVQPQPIQSQPIPPGAVGQNRRSHSLGRKLLGGLLASEAIALVGLLAGGSLVALEVRSAEQAIAQTNPVSDSGNGATPAALRGLAKAGGLVLLLLLLRMAIALKLIQALIQPLALLRAQTEVLATGDLQARSGVSSNDAFGQFSQNLDQMAVHLSMAMGEQAEQTAQQIEHIRQEAERQQQNAEKQERETRRLQQRVMELLIEIDGAREGDLTVRAKVSDDEMGSVADAFNATVSSLQDLVLQAQQIATQVSDSATGSEQSVNALAHSATEQARSMAEALLSVEEVSQSIETVASTAAEAAQISRQASAAATEGGGAMDQTVASINELRGSVAETSKKVKRLTESSQEISRIVALISEVSAKTNLLAFNASVEAVRAGEHGQGFRVVADEVRRLAEQVTYATQEIEQLVSGIQLETSEVLTMMEKGTEQVVTGSQLVNETRTTLSSLVATNQQIDGLLQTISSRTASQTEVSQAMRTTMQSVAAIAEQSSAESNEVAHTLQLLVGVSQALQHSVAQFRA